MKKNNKTDGSSPGNLGRGTGIHRGLAMGKALVLRIHETSIFPVPIAPREIEKEVEKFRGALAVAEEQLKKIKADKEKYCNCGFYDGRERVLKNGCHFDPSGCYHMHGCLVRLYEDQTNPRYPNLN